MKNQYTPPTATVADPPPVKRNPPPEVRLAVWLLWVSFVVALPLMYVQLERVPAGARTWFVAIFGLLMLALMAGIYIGIHRGKNWARIAFLLIELLSLAAAIRIPEPFGATVVEAILTTLGWLASIAALYLLFFTQGSAWFKKSSSHA